MSESPDPESTYVEAAALPPPALITPAPAWFFERGPSAFRYILRMWPTSLLPSMALALVTFTVFATLGLDTEKPGPTLADFSGASRSLVFAIVIVFAPAVETLLLSLGIGLISLFTARPLVIAGISAILWGILHATAFKMQGIVVVWPFFVFSCAYLAWRPVGWLQACGVAMGIHMLQNLLPGLAMLFV